MRERNGQPVADLRDLMQDYSITFEISGRPVLDYGEDLDLIHDIEGKILYEAEMKKAVKVGKIRAQKLGLGEALERRISWFDLCDSQSQELHDAYVAVFDLKKGNSIREDLELEMFGDILLIHEISIIPKHRGRDLGLVAMHQTLKSLGGGCSMAVIKPFPLQFSCKVTEKNRKECDAAQEKLREHWGRVGFMRIEGTDYYYIDLACRIPTAEDLLGLEADED